MGLTELQTNTMMEMEKGNWFLEHLIHLIKLMKEGILSVISHRKLHKLQRDTTNHVFPVANKSNILIN